MGEGKAITVGFGLGVVGMGVVAALVVGPVLYYGYRRLREVEEDNGELTVWNTHLAIERGIKGGGVVEEDYGDDMNPG